MADQDRAFAAFKAQLLVYRAMCAMPALENGLIQEEFRQLVRVREYLRKQCDIALQVVRNCTLCEGGMIEGRDPVSGDWMLVDCPCCEGRACAPADRIEEFERQRGLVQALDMCALAEML